MEKKKEIGVFVVYIMYVAEVLFYSASSVKHQSTEYFTV